MRSEPPSAPFNKHFRNQSENFGQPHRTRYSITSKYPIFGRPHSRYIYEYIYMCVSVCVCVLCKSKRQQIFPFRTTIVIHEYQRYRSNTCYTHEQVTIIQFRFIPKLIPELKYTYQNWEISDRRLSRCFRPVYAGVDIFILIIVMRNYIICLPIQTNNIIVQP